MSKTALLALNSKTSRWEATYGSKVIVSSPNKKYVIDVITKGLNGKAKSLGITKVEELGSASSSLPAHTTPLIEFDVNERFQFLEDYIDMIATRDMKSVVVVGEGGLGKTFTVLRQLERNGMKEHSIHAEDYEIGAVLSAESMRKKFVVVKGYSTPKGLFRTLFENQNSLIMFDDCDSILENDVAANILKAALDMYEKRIVSWNSEGWGESDLPKSFEFTGAVIFVSNLSMHKIPQAIISRSVPADVSMSRAEILQRMGEIIKSPDFMPDESMEHKKDALGLIAENINNPQVKAINLRSLMKVVTMRRSKPERWKRLGLSAMMAES